MSSWRQIFLEYGLFTYVLFQMQILAFNRLCALIDAWAKKKDNNLDIGSPSNINKLLILIIFGCDPRCMHGLVWKISQWSNGNKTRPLCWNFSQLIPVFEVRICSYWNKRFYLCLYKCTMRSITRFKDEEFGRNPGMLKTNKRWILFPHTYRL